MRRRLAAFGVLCIVLAAVGWAYLERTRPEVPPPTAPAADIRVTSGADALARVRARPHLVFRNTMQAKGYGRVALAALDAPAERVITDLACDRVYFADGHGICLGAERGVFTTYDARLFDALFAAGPPIALSGPPSRARVSPNGQRAAYTVFETGHSYAAAKFSTRTTIVDTATSRPVGELEQWEVVRNGEPFRAVDFNFWGVTFTRDGDRFYATLGTGGRVFLVEGSIAARRMRLRHEGVECPSLSPDETRLVYKSRRTEGGRLIWGLRILDLVTDRETALDGETRSVDDQAAWLDDRHVMYGLPEDRVPPTGGTDVWVMEARPGAAPRRLLEQASSPALVR